MSMKNSFRTTYHPQSSGQVEVYNRTILAALRTYVVDDSRDWDLYTDEPTYMYNYRPHMLTSVAPLELVLSKPLGPIALKTMPLREELQGDFKREWKHWLQDTLKKTKERLDKARARYNNDYNARLRMQAEVIRADDYEYLWVERKNPTYHKHKLEPVAKGPCKLVNADAHAVTIEKAADPSRLFCTHALSSNRIRARRRRRRQ